MTIFYFNTYVAIQAENYDEAIDTFDFKTKELNVYVADIQEEEVFANG
jgi:hypothetical protein